MATTRKTTDTAAKEEQAKAAPAPKATEAKKNSQTYSEQAASLADDVRALAEDMRDKLAEVIDRCGKVNETAPNPDDLQAANGVRRIPLATEGVTRALNGLMAVAADLALKVTR